MKTVILSDIHANAPALNAVLQDAGSFERLIFLGDLANFGPHPAQCVDMLEKYDPVCIMGNHDEQIVSDNPTHDWDLWSKKQLNSKQQDWIRKFKNSVILDGHILLVHGSYSVDYNILPNTPDRDIKNAFKDLLTPEIDQVWFGHYHYQTDRTIDGVEYHCIRPVGHHRDKDTRAGYSVYENGMLIHKRVEYELAETIADVRKLNVFENDAIKEMFEEFLKNAYHEILLTEDICQMQKNAQATE